MSLQILKFFTLLVFALTVYGNNTNGDDLSDVLLGDVDNINQNVYGTKNKDDVLDDLKERTLTKPTLPPPIYRPTPPTINPELPIVTKDPPAVLLPETPEIILEPITLPDGQIQPIKPAQVTSPVATVPHPHPIKPAQETAEQPQPIKPAHVIAGQPQPIKPAQETAGQSHPIKPAQVTAGQPQPIKPVQVTAGKPQPIKPAQPAGQPQPIKPAGTSTVNPAGLPILIPPQRPSEPTFTAPICGRKKNCYQWFDHASELALEGYNRCDARDERRAKRYCCIP